MIEIHKITLCRDLRIILKNSKFWRILKEAVFNVNEKIMFFVKYALLSFCLIINKKTDENDINRRIKKNKNLNKFQIE